jgi:aldose 1-epimerase
MKTYTLENANGLSATIIAYGATLISVRTPDRDGNIDEITVGMEDPEDYRQGHPFLGSVVGRCANRLANARFTLNGKEYQLESVGGPHHLHGGRHGFDKVDWNVLEEPSGNRQSLKLGYTSADGEEGYPGKLDVEVTYSLSDDDTLTIDYRATSDQDTIVNLTNHVYFNLSGAPTILDHELQLFASHFTPIDETLIPTGEIRPVEGTPMDFRQMTRIGERIEQDDDQLRYGRGYDHNWVLDHGGGKLGPAAVLYGPKSGRVVEVATTKPGIQFYSGNFLTGSVRGRGGSPIGYRSGLCLETQYFPNAINQPNFPSPILRAGETYHHITTYHFTTK